MSGEIEPLIPDKNTRKTDYSGTNSGDDDDDDHDDDANDDVNDDDDASNGTGRTPTANNDEAMGKKAQPKLSSGKNGNTDVLKQDVDVPNDAGNGTGIDPPHAPPQNEATGKKAQPKPASDEIENSDAPQQDDDVAKHGVQIDNLGCERLRLEVHKNLKKHRLACQYFKFRNYWFFQAPQALLAMTCTILAFLAGSDIFDGNNQKLFATVAGCTSGIVVFLQTMSGYCGYDLKASMHDGTAIDLRDLNDDLSLMQSKLMRTEALKRKEEDDGIRSSQQQKSLNDEHDTFEYLQSRYRHALQGCKSIVPIQISEAFLEIDSHIMLSRTTNNRQYLRDCGMFQAQNFRGITFKSYDRLTSNIVNHRSWPIFIPGPKMVAEMTMDDVRSDLHKMKSFWVDPAPAEPSSFWNAIILSKRKQDTPLLPTRTTIA